MFPRDFTEKSVGGKTSVHPYMIVKITAKRFMERTESNYRTEPKCHAGLVVSEQNIHLINLDKSWEKRDK